MKRPDLDGIQNLTGFVRVSADKLREVHAYICFLENEMTRMAEHLSANAKDWQELADDHMREIRANGESRLRGET